MVIQHFGVYLVPLDPTVGHEIGKTRPCIVIGPDEMNRHVRTVLIAPMTSVVCKYPFRVDCFFAGRHGQVALDHIRGIDRSRFVKHLGKLDERTEAAISQTLVKLFSIDSHQK